MRTVLVTGAASGIGEATARQLREGGCRVIGLDREGCDVNIDLSKPEARRAAVEQVLQMTSGRLDGYVASAGLSRHAGDERAVMAVNFFGAFEPLLGLRDALACGEAPAVVLVSSWGMLRTWADPEAIAACLAMDEPAALARVEANPASHGPAHLRPAYATSKAAMGRMGRRLACAPEWAGAGITINVIAPSVTRTPMTASDFATPEGTARIMEAAPSPMGRIAEAQEMADVICFFAEGRGRYVTGQVIFVDGGLDALRRPEDPILPLAAERWT